MHKRQLVRDAIVALITAAPNVDLTDRVFANRARPTEPRELPVVLVYTVAETSEQITFKGDLMRTLTAAVEVRASFSPSLDNALDGLCQAVELAIAGTPQLNGLAVNSTLVSTTIGLDGEGEGRQAIGTMNFEIQYHTTPAGV